ncbi:chorismate-binding protein [Cellulomonas denverensis]|uniref:Anthranilate synthase component I family protein n=1 Tax=Cellulomonas denverensis TaxID=264297 RepID=A0A7X6QYB5_9CELL|nr:anthranilate synthase component I family protein [Cellulomonas denverensis]NKY21821.1 anthranilate synthase component I family protein [Cellulomonas denverensis]
MGGRELRDVCEHVPDVAAEPARLRTPGHWVLVGDFDGPVRAWRFARAGQVRPAAHPWRGPGEWHSSLDREAYLAGVRRIRAEIRAGEVYQANLCRVLSAALPQEPDAAALADRLAAGNPAPFAGAIQVPGQWVVSASPELFLRIADGRISSAPIKGTARTPDGLTDKDRSENVMIADLVRNDLQRICRPGTVTVEDLLAIEHHPGLVHLVTTVSGVLDTTDWRAVLAATFPPGSVSGAPKSSALRIIAELETAPRGPYCGLVGWAEVGEDGALTAELAVGIRTFWWEDGVLRFGTGAGITWGSEPEAEWAETELKAERLIGLATGEPA